MSREETLARLIDRVARGEHDIGTLRAIVEEASEIGASRVLLRLGLSDDAAQGDIDELRDLLGAWRTAKASAWRAAVDWFVRGLLALLLIGIAMRLGVAELLE